MSRILIAAAAVVLALGACSRGEDHGHGAGVQVAGATIASQLPANLPDYVKVYPGATIIKAVGNGPQGGVIAFTVSATPDAVADFYRKAAAAAKLEPSMDTAGGAGNHVILWTQQGGKRSLMATVDPKQGKTQVTLLYGAAS